MPRVCVEYELKMCRKCKYTVLGMHLNTWGHSGLEFKLSLFSVASINLIQCLKSVNSKHLGNGKCVSYRSSFTA